MSRVTRDGTAEPVARDQIFRRERRQGSSFFLVQLTTSRIGNHTRLIHSILKVLTWTIFRASLFPHPLLVQWTRAIRTASGCCSVFFLTTQASERKEKSLRTWKERSSRDTFSSSDARCLYLLCQQMIRRCESLPGYSTQEHVYPTVFPPDWGMLRRSRCVLIFL